ncbi:transcription termination factor Rho [Actinopolymorpha sp. B9G3]|uniref:transcription termination factor Rho n=1 Tax=Actinopolymorpha sp. B9G3 TaxID=3158970 RepID=UPI0032D8E4C7
MTETTDLTTAPASDAHAGDAPATEDGGTPTRRRRASGLAGMVLAELQQVAQGLGITGTARMRKSQLIDAIKAAQAAGGQATDGGSASADRPASKRDRRTQSAEGQTQIDIADGQSEGGDATRSRGRRADKQDKQNGQQADTDGDRAADRGEEAAAKDGTEGRGDNSSESGRDGGRESRGSGRDGGRGGRDGSRDNNRDGGRGSREHSSQNQRDGGRDNRDSRDGDDDEGGRGRRRRRSRDRFRDRRSGGGRSDRYDGEPQVNEDDVLIPVAGILDVLDNYAFVRTSGFLPGPNDVYVSLAMVKKYGLRKGDAMSGAIRQPREGERREKFNPLVRVDTVNGADPELSRQRPDFGKLTPLYPQERLRLETEPNIPTTRIIDLIAPIGKGQRALIVSPSKAGKTLIMQAIANAITQNNPEAHLMVVLVDERPEEVTDMQRAVKGEVIASTFDRPADDHTTVAELAIERAKRLVELGHDVVVLLDSITRLGRAYNLAAPASGRILSGGVDSSALYPPKRFFGAARNIEHGGSLTIIATALIETGSKMDEVIFEEFKGTGNMELRLRREYADKRIFPAIDVDASSTRREELLMGKEELGIVWKLRRVMSGLDGQQALELLLNRLKDTRSNVEFLMQINKTMPGAGGNSSSRDDD